MFSPVAEAVLAVRPMLNTAAHGGSLAAALSKKGEEKNMCHRCDIITLRMGRSAFEYLQKLLESNKLVDGDKEVGFEFQTVIAPELELWTTTQEKEKEA